MKKVPLGECPPATATGAEYRPETPGFILTRQPVCHPQVASLQLQQFHTLNKQMKWQGDDLPGQLGKILDQAIANIAFLNRPLVVSSTKISR